MDSSSQQDILSSLPDVILVLIISFLPFKECVSTSALSKRWRHLCHETKNIAFKESEYVSRSISDQQSRLVARRSFFLYMRQWVSRVCDQVIESFEICFSNPVGFTEQIKALIEFAVSKQVKKLVLDFSNPAWISFGNVSYLDLVVELPESVYSLTTLESLKIYACKFDPSRFTNPRLLRSLSIGWIRLTNVESLLSKSPLLESLSLKHCWGLDITMIAGQLRELVIENSDFSYMTCSFDLPKVNILKYSGLVFPFYFDRMNMIIKEVYLDFGLEREYDEPTQSTQVAGDVLSGFLNGLRAARTLTVCPYLLQAIQECVNPYYLLHPVEAQYLVLKTKMHPKEFNGIRLLLSNCPNIETLTFDILPPSSFPMALSYAGIDRRTYWMKNITYKCLRNVVVVKNFGGSSNELNMLRYLIRSGGESGHALEKVELHMPNGLEENQKMLARVKAEMLQRTSERVQVLVHNA